MSIIKPDDVEIRHAKKEDMIAVAGLIQDLADFQNMSDGPKMKATDLLRDGFETNPPAFRILVAENKRNLEMYEVIGYALYFPTYSTWEGPSMMLEDLYVKPAYRRNGIGKRLFNAVVKFTDNTFKNFYYPGTNDDDEASDEEGTPGYKIKQAIARKRAGNCIDGFFEIPKKKPKTAKKSSSVSQSNNDGVAYLSSGRDDAVYSSHLIKIEIYDVQKIKNIAPGEQWKHADVRLKFYTSSEEDKQLESTRDVIFNITKQLVEKDTCVKYFIENKK